MRLKGCVIPHSPIAINMWDIKNYPTVKFFFFSHFHPDHICGLTSSWAYPIYASPISCKLLQNKLNIKPSLLHSLEVGQACSLSIGFEDKEKISVTAFDANHCHGAIVLLFQGYFGNVLYTGDFRYTPDMLDFSQLPAIDILYLDNKYCAKECVFPSRDTVFDNILNLVHSCLRKSKQIYIGMDDLGKEDLLLKLAAETYSKVFVTDSKKSILHILGFSNVIAPVKSEAKIIVVPTRQITAANVEKWNSEKPICAVLPSARYCGFSFRPYSKHDNIHVEPLSGHSSFTELLTFVDKVHPRSVIPIIGKNEKAVFGIDISIRADMSVFQNSLNLNPRPDISIPDSVKNAMNLWVLNAEPSRPKKKRKISPPPKRKGKKQSKRDKNLSLTNSSSSSEEKDDTQTTYEYCWEINRIETKGVRKILRLNP